MKSGSCVDSGLDQIPRLEPLGGFWEICGVEAGGGDSSQTKKKRVAREQRNKHKPTTEQEQHLPIRHVGRPADFLLGVFVGRHHVFSFPFLIYRSMVEILIKWDSI